VLPYYPASNITLITVGNEILTLADQSLASQLVPAMRNLQNALNTASVKIKVSTVHSMAVLTQSDPPSSGLFNPALQNTLKQLLAVLKDNKSPFTINPYPFFAYQSDTRPETLAFCLFQPNSGRVDSGNGKLYTNMFDAQVSTVYVTVFSVLNIFFITKSWRGSQLDNHPLLSTFRPRVHTLTIFKSSSSIHRVDR